MLKISLIVSLFCFVSFHSMAQKEDPKQYVKDWVQAHPDVKIIPQSMYNRYTENEKAAFNAIPKKFVYQTYLTKEDIVAYEKSLQTVTSEENQQSH